MCIRDRFFSGHPKHGICGHEIYEIIGEAQILYILSRLLGEHADTLMELLAVSPPFHRIHHDILRGHKGELFLDVAVDDLLMDHQSGTHILINIEDGIDREECLCLLYTSRCV